ncbi:MAG: hypothetical protein ACN4GT_09660, partial [Gammaproteobacteria bacterium]
RPHHDPLCISGAHWAQNYEGFAFEPATASRPFFMPGANRALNDEGFAVSQNIPSQCRNNG